MDRSHSCDRAGRPTANLLLGKRLNCSLRVETEFELHPPTGKLRCSAPAGIPKRNVASFETLSHNQAPLPTSSIVYLSKAGCNFETSLPFLIVCPARPSKKQVVWTGCAPLPLSTRQSLPAKLPLVSRGSMETKSCTSSLTTYRSLIWPCASSHQYDVCHC